MTRYTTSKKKKSKVKEDYSDFFDYLTDYISSSKRAKETDNYGGLWVVELNKEDYDRAFEIINKMRYNLKHRILWNGGYSIEEKDDGDERDALTLTYLKNEFEVTLNKNKVQRKFKKS